MNTLAFRYPAVREAPRDRDPSIGLNTRRGSGDEATMLPIVGPPRTSLCPPLIAILLAVAARPAPAGAGAGVQIGGRGGVELIDERALSLGADLRLSFALSPLTVAVTFDHFAVPDGETLFQVGASALHDLPTPISFLRPYGGAGMSVTRFAVPEEPGVEDASGMRIGLNLVAGLRVEHTGLPVARPFVQMTGTVGPIDLITIGGGVLFELGGG